MSSRLALGALAAMITAAAVTIQLKHEVLERERELTRLRTALVDAGWRQRTLRADIAFLARPDRLMQQAEQLGMQPVRAAQLARIAELPSLDLLALAETVLPVTLPTGETVALRFRPPAVAPLGTARPR
jgi:hypothetical protein